MRCRRMPKLPAHACHKLWSWHAAALVRGIFRLRGCPALYDGGLNPQHGVRDLVCSRARDLHLMGSIEMVSFSRRSGLRNFEVTAQGPEPLILEFCRFLRTLVKVRECDEMHCQLSLCGSSVTEVLVDSCEGQRV